MPDARSKLLLISLFVVAACRSQSPGGDDDDLVLTSTGEMSTGNMTNTTLVSTVTGLMTQSTSSTSSSSSTTDATDTDATSTGSTSAPSICGNSIVEGDEECDDGNTEDDDDCTTACVLPSCGDGITYKGVEECDDGNDDDTDSCTSLCKDAECGDGFPYLGFEECDDGNEDNSDACTEMCTVAKCGDGYTQAGEVCDNAKNMNEYNGCAPGCKKLAPHCGDDIVQTDEGERCDTSPPHASVTCNDNCTFNFANATQLYCAASCTWDAQPGCQEGDADIFCQLQMGSPTAHAKSFNPNTNVGKPNNGSGFPCANVNLQIQDDIRINLGKLPEFGIGDPVLWQNKDILDTHGDGDTIVNIVCIDP